MVIVTDHRSPGCIERWDWNILLFRKSRLSSFGREIERWENSSDIVEERYVLENSTHIRGIALGIPIDNLAAGRDITRAQTQLRVSL